MFSVCKDTIASQQMQMKHKNRIIGVFWMLLLTVCAEAQVVGRLVDDELYDTRVKLVDEFFERFNGKTYRPDIMPETEDAELRNLLVLFNASMFTSFEDSAFAEAKLFARKVLRDSIRINYRDTTWVAKATCHGRLKGKEVEFVLYLNVEHRRDRYYKWVIAKAEGDVFRLSPSMEKETIMLMPDDHETNFMSLKRITTEKDDYILNYKGRGFEVDETSVFYSLVYSGLLDIEYVRNLEFVFFQVPGYKFTVSHFERDNFNAGWLISALEKMSEEEKTQFLNYIYNKGK